MSEAAADMNAITDTASAVNFLKEFAPNGPWCVTGIVPDGVTETRTFKRGEERQLHKWLEMRQGKANLHFHVNRVKGDLDTKAKKAISTA